MRHTVAILDEFPSDTGIGVYAVQVRDVLASHGVQAALVRPNPLTRGGSTRGQHSYMSPNRASGRVAEVRKLLGLNVRELRRVEADILHLSSPSLIGVAKHRKNVAVTVHDTCVLDFAGNSLVMSRYYRRCLTEVARAPVVLCDSEFSRNQAVSKLRIDEHKLFTCYPTCDATKWSPSIENNLETADASRQPKLILHVGYDGPTKNVATLYRVMARLPEDYHLVRIGRNSRRNLRLLHDLGISNRVTLLDNLSRPEVYSYYRRASCFVFPSLCEGFGLPVLEAMASGLPCVVSNRGSLPEVAGEAAIVVEPDLPETIADKIQSLENQQSRFERIRSGLQQAATFNGERMFKSLKAAYSVITDDFGTQSWTVEAASFDAA